MGEVSKLEPGPPLPMTLMSHSCVENTLILSTLNQTNSNSIKIICTGGWTVALTKNGARYLQFSDKTLIYDTTEAAWSFGPELNRARMKHSSIATKFGIFVMGGYNYQDLETGEIEFMSGRDQSRWVVLKSLEIEDFGMAVLSVASVYTGSALKYPAL